MSKDKRRKKGKNREIEEIGERLRQIKHASESGYYAPIVEAELSEKGNNEILTLTLDYPNGGFGKYSLSVPEYWEEGRHIVEFFDYIDISVEEIEQLLERSIPITRKGGGWEVDLPRLEDGDYLEGSHNTEQ